MYCPSIVSSAELFADAREVVIEHGSQCYLLTEGPDGQLLLVDLPATARITCVALHRMGGMPCRKPRGTSPVEWVRDPD